VAPNLPNITFINSLLDGDAIDVGCFPARIGVSINKECKLKDSLKLNYNIHGHQGSVMSEQFES